MRVLELFAGYGSQALALENLGIEFTSDISEIDTYAIKAYNQIHGETHNWGDITKINKTKLPYYDLITYSSPCQDFSVAGKQQGGDKGSGTRSSLLWECERIIKAVKPKYLLMENVKNLVGEKHKHNFIRWLRVLEMMGYWNFWQVLNAKDYGVPQNRERVFVVSIRKDLNKHYIFPSKQELKIKLKDILEPIVDERYYLSDKVAQRLLKYNDRVVESSGLYLNVSERFLRKPTQGISRCLKAEKHDAGVVYVPDEKVITDYRIRKLTPRECWRLMGVKDEQFNKLKGLSNTQLYKMAGNSIVVNVLEEIFKNLLTEKGQEEKGQLILI